MNSIRKMAAWTLTGVLALSSVPGVAANYASNGNYTAYSGPDGYLYLVDTEGSAKRMRAKELDILSMDETTLYFASGAKIYGIELAAGKASVRVSAAEEADLLSYRLMGAYALTDDGKLYLNGQQVAQGVACVTANSKALYFAMDEGDGCALYSMPIDGGDMKREKVTLDNPKALAAAENYVIVLDAGEVKAYDTAKWKTKKVKLPKGEVEDMFLRGKELALYVQGDELTLETQTLSYVTPVAAVAALPEQNKAAVKTEPQEEEPQQEEKEEPVKEEAKQEEAKEEPKKEEKKSTVDTTGWKTLRRGMKGKNVRTVQQRLRKLGYPVGEVDGDYGSKTIRAMRFFQAIAGLEITGLTDAETYAALMAKDAPKYDGRGKVESSSKKDDEEDKTADTAP